MNIPENVSAEMEKIFKLLKDGSVLDIKEISEKLTVPTDNIVKVVKLLAEKDYVSENGNGKVSLTEVGKDAIGNLLLLKESLTGMKNEESKVSDVINMENFAKIKNFIDSSEN